jgi:hypothetical protein
VTPSISVWLLAALLGATVAACGGARPGGSAPTERVLLAGGYLDALLPSGERIAPDSPNDASGILAVVTHQLRRTSGVLRIESLDIGQRVTPTFAADAVAMERRAQCAGAEARLVAEPGLAAPDGFAVVAFAPVATCDGGSPPDARLYVSTPDGAVIQLEFLCEAPGCLPDRRAVLEAFVGSFQRAAPPSSAGGTRFLGLSSGLGLSLVVPEGFVVRQYSGEDSTAFAVVRPAHVDGPADMLSVAFHFSSSPNTLAEDYASTNEQARTFQGRVAGQDVELLELTGPSRRRTIARLELAAVSIDVVIRAESDEVHAQLMRAIGDAVVRDPDAEDYEDDEDDFSP